ncbi:hypothetical protein, partial [Xanthomonas euvesicatoria]|uniref:hypothetical protein n=1 Tax=Xanthomonas euvesicatoria TaxID=456327 RepID=UPI0019D3B763
GGFFVFGGLLRQQLAHPRCHIAAKYLRAALKPQAIPVCTTIAHHALACILPACDPFAGVAATVCEGRQGFV